VNDLWAPSLFEARGYHWEEFDQLLVAGLARDGRWVRHAMAVARVYGLSPEERRAVFDYLAAYHRP
jgi:hypothetical protein